MAGVAANAGLERPLREAEKLNPVDVSHNSPKMKNLQCDMNSSTEKQNVVTHTHTHTYIHTYTKLNVFPS